jgi:hypothetical protein
MSLRFPCSTNSNSSKVFDFGPHHINSTIITSIELQNSWLVQLWTALSKEDQKASSLHIPGIVFAQFYLYQNKSLSNIIFLIYLAWL